MIVKKQLKNKLKGAGCLKKLDAKTWDRLILEVEKKLARKIVSEDKKEIIIKGYKEIRDILGEDFLQKSSNSISSLLSDITLWSLLKNADFGQKLGILKNINNFEDIKQDLLLDNFENSYGAEAVVEVAGDFIKKGLKVELLSREEKKRTPDFRVKGDNKWIYFEITTFRTYSDEIKNIYNFCNKLQTCINQICLTHARFIEVDFKGMIRKNAEYYIDRIISKAIEMVQSPEELENVVCGVRLKILKKEEGYGIPYIHGIKRTTNEMESISGKLSDKLRKKQLPDGERGVLLIFTRSPFLPSFHVLASELSKIVNDKTNLCAAVIQYICLEQIDCLVANNKFRVTHRTEHDGIYNRYNIVIPNLNFEIEGATNSVVSVL